MVILWWFHGDFIVILWWFHSDLMGLYEISWWFYGDFMLISWCINGVLWGFMGFHGDFRVFYWWFYWDIKQTLSQATFIITLVLVHYSTLGWWDFIGIYWEDPTGIDWDWIGSDFCSFWDYCWKIYYYIVSSERMVEGWLGEIAEIAILCYWEYPLLFLGLSSAILGLLGKIPEVRHPLAGRRVLIFVGFFPGFVLRS